MITLRIGTVEKLTQHVTAQLGMLYPLSDMNHDTRTISKVILPALQRMSRVISQVRNFPIDCFDHFNTLQYASFLYILSNTIWRLDNEADIVDRLFGLNKMISGIELFPSIDLPEPFFLSHAIGTVLGNVRYGGHLVVFQNVTVGRVGESRPQIGDRVTLFAGAMITGSSVIGAGSVIAAGTHVHNWEVPPGSLVSGRSRDLRVAPLRRDYQTLFFR